MVKLALGIKHKKLVELKMLVRWREYLLIRLKWGLQLVEGR